MVCSVALLVVVATAACRSHISPSLLSVGNITVAIRLRPLGTQELVQPRRSRRGSILGEARAWSLRPEEATTIKASSGRCGSGSTLFQKGALRRTTGRTDFSFDAVFDENVHTSQVYQDIARPIVKGVASGRHGTIFSYGQTGMGKTFTMQGCGNSVDTANFGIIQMAAVDLFRMIESSSSQREYVVKAQYFEIYNEQIRDLLPKTQASCEKTNSLLELPVLSAQEDPVTQNVHVNAYEEKVNSVDDVCRLLRQGNQNRACAATNLNAQSSRSHGIFRLLLESRERRAGEADDQTMRVSVLNMVDLAGSENSLKAGVTGIRKREGGKINQR
jgi:centromeric protein E